MEDLKERAAPQGGNETTFATPPKRAGRTAFKVLLYILATVGLLVLAIVGYAIFDKNRHPARERLTIDEAAMVDSVMTSNYGKYSATKKGWVYVDEENTTYVMRVVQQVRLQDSPDGDELYMIASGEAVGGEGAMYGAFHIRPGKGNEGSGLVEVSSPFEAAGPQAIKPEQVHFEALSSNLWGWVIKVADFEEPELGGTVLHNRVLAPHDGQIVTLAEFPAARTQDPGTDCAEAKVRYDEYMKQEEPVSDPPVRCDKRRWTYGTGVVNGDVPVPITVTAGGSLDGQPVEAKKYKLVFDSKRFRYNVPADLE